VKGEWNGEGEQGPLVRETLSRMHGSSCCIKTNLSNESIEIVVAGSLTAQVAAAQVEDGLVVDHEGAVGVLERRVRRQDRVVRLDDGGRHARRRIHGELELRLFRVLDAQALHQQRGEAGSSSAAETVRPPDERKHSN